MSNSSKIALKIVHRILTTTRSNAFLGMDAQTIARILDDAEYLLSLIMQGEDCLGGEFETYLEGFSAKFTDFSRLAEAYREELKASSLAEVPVAVAA